MLGRGEHCPRERQHQKLMVPFHEMCPVAFTELVTILPGELHDYVQDANRHRRALDVPGRRRPRAADPCSKSANTRTSTTPPTTVPHTLVLAPGLVIDKVYVGYWFWGRPSPNQLWEDLQDLHRRIKPDF